MKHLFLITAVLLIVRSNFCYCQYDWKQGLIIRNNGDTVYGYIDDRVISTSQRTCYFKSSENGEIERFSPVQIMGYRFSNGKYFVSKKIKFAEKEDSMFLEFLLKGHVSIYHYLGANERYFVEKDGELTELENSEVKLHIGDKEYLRKKNEFIGSLNIIMQDANMQNEIRKTRYQSESLINIAKEYNEKMCPDEQCIIYEKEKVKTKTDFGFTIGMNSKTINFEYFDTRYDLNNKTSFFGGITISIYGLPGSLKNFSLNGEGLINSYYFGNKLKKCLNIPLMVGYKLDNENICRIEAGISNYFMESIIHFAPLVGIGFYFKDEAGPGFYIKARVEDIPAYFRIGAGIVF